MHHDFIRRGIRCAVLALLACSCSSTGSEGTDPSAGGKAGGAASGGVKSGAGGQVALGTGGFFVGASGGRANDGGGGRASGGAAVSAAGGAVNAARGGVPGLPPAAAGFPSVVPPPAASDGSSPYLRECHGDTLSCVDVANLRCLGIRDGNTVEGYACSNPCASNSECSTAATNVGARAACVDFVTQKHCLLVCLENGEKRDCPSGMSCYNYPGNPLGYCLWK